MNKDAAPTVIKKYANRRLYNTGTSTYVTLDDLAEMVKAEEDFVVVDAKSGDDITHSVLTQIIFEQETRGHNMLPVNFLRQLIRFYGDSMQTLVPSYLDYSMSTLTHDQDMFREQMAKTLGSHGGRGDGGAGQAQHADVRAGLPDVLAVCTDDAGSGRDFGGCRQGRRRSR